MAPTFLDQLTHFCNFLTAYMHTVFALRDLYPRESFLRARFHNTSVFQSRHPAVCNWITDAVANVRTHLLAGGVQRILILVYHVPSTGGNVGSLEVLERFVLDVSQFPVLSKQEREMGLRLEGSDTEPEEEQGHDVNLDEETGEAEEKPLDADVDVDTSEQFRAALVMLTTRCGQLKPLPPNCSPGVAIEQSTDSHVDPPVGHPQAWIPAQPSLQKNRSAHGVRTKNGKDTESSEDGRLGGVRSTPIRSVEAGILRFEAWVEEAKTKFEQE